MSPVRATFPSCRRLDSRRPTCCLGEAHQFRRSYGRRRWKPESARELLARNSAEMRWLGAMVVVAALSMVAVAAGAQDPEPQPALAAGLSAGTMRWRGGLERQVLTAALAYQPHPWLTVLAAPTAVRMIPSDGPAASGPGDVPVSVGLNKQLRGPASPVLGAGLVVSLPVGSQSNALGSGSGGWGSAGGPGWPRGSGRSST